MPAPDDERLGLLYEIAVNQAEVTQTAVKNLTATVDELQQLPANVRAEISRLLSQSATDATKPAAQIAEEAAKDFRTEVREAAQTLSMATQEAARAFGMVQWWILLAIFVLGALCGSAGLWLAHTPQASPIYLDTAKVAAEVTATCRKR